MTDLATITGSLEQCYDAIESLAARMGPREWAAQSLCPDWDMRGVIAHLGMMERVMTGWLPDGAEDLPPVDRIGPYQDKLPDSTTRLSPRSSPRSSPPAGRPRPAAGS